MKLAGGTAAAAVQGAANVAFSDTVKGKAMQGAAELSSALFSQSNAYSPYTADTAAHRAQFQQSRSRSLSR